MEQHHQVRLVIDPEVRKVIEKRRLKDEEIQKTIFHAEKTGQKFIHPETGNFLAGQRAYFVTVWVEYRPCDDGFEIYSAYQHRVKITGGQTS